MTVIFIDCKFVCWLELVAEKLMEEFGCSYDEAREIIKYRPIVLRSEISLEEAKIIKINLEKWGAKIEIV